MPPAESTTRAQRISPACVRTRATRGSGFSSRQRASSFARIAPAAATISAATASDRGASGARGIGTSSVAGRGRSI
jgi:hypothetical protein